jgi:hypothetical protein
MWLQWPQGCQFFSHLMEAVSVCEIFKAAVASRVLFGLWWPSRDRQFSKAFLFLTSILMLVPSPFGAATYFLDRTLMLSQSPFRNNLLKQLLLDF